MSRAFIGIGSNIDPEANVLAAVRLLNRSARVTAVSTFYRTRAIGRPEQADFYNGVVEIITDLPPRDLKFSLLRGIEAHLGRVRGADRFASRTIDLDLLLYDSLYLDDEDLKLPDPQVARRPFLAIPLLELAPDLPLPGSSLTLREIAARLPRQEMEPLPEYTARVRREIGHEP